MVLFPAFLLFNIHYVFADIMYIDAKRHIQGHAEPEVTEDENVPLPLSSFFAQSDTYKCLVENNGDKNCIKHDGDKNGRDKQTFYGPRFQNIHLALPVRKPSKVGHTDKINFNNREMLITTRSKTPQIYEISNFLSANETELIIDLSQQKGMTSLTPQRSLLHMQETIDERIFDQWDEDFDGHISIKEMSNLVELNPLLLSEDDLEKIIEKSKVDEDGNKYLSFGELSNGGLKQLVDTFKEYDHERRMFQVNGMKNTLLWHDEDELCAYEDLLEDFHGRLHEITNIPTEILEQSEQLQVTQHETNSATHCQQDSMSVTEKPCCTYGSTNCRMCRYATMLIFLNDIDNGGELVFPLADNNTFSWQNLKKDTIEKCEKTPNPNVSNVIIKPQRCKAVLWYNHAVSPLTGWIDQMDPQSLAGITPVQNGSLWTAKFWVNINGDGIEEFRPWKMGTNWLKGNNKNEKIVDKMRNDYFVEGERYIHHYRESYRYVYHELENSEEQKTTVNKEFSLAPNPSQKHEVLEENGKQEILQENTQVEEITTENVLSDTETTVNVDSDNDLSTDVTIETVTENIEITDTIEKVEGKITEPLPPPETKTNEVPSNNDFIKDYLPLGPPKRPVDPLNPYAGKLIENRLVRASLLLLEELERDELEIIARSLHDKLQLACIPLIMNPIQQ